MSIYAIADIHLSKAPDRSKPMDIFGDRWIDHENRIEKNWREIVGEEDTVIIPGDISWGLKLEDSMYDLDWIHSMPGKKVLIKGNHDLWWTGINRLNRLYEDDIRFLQYDSVTVEGVSIAAAGAGSPRTMRNSLRPTKKSTIVNCCAWNLHSRRRNAMKSSDSCIFHRFQSRRATRDSSNCSRIMA